MILDKFAAISLRDIHFKPSSSLLFVFLLFSAITSASAASQSNLRIEKSKISELNDQTIRSLGSLKLEGENMAHIDLVHTESLSQGKKLALDFGGGYVAHGSISFFLGVGVSLEYSFDFTDSGGTYHASDFSDKYYAEVGAVYDLSKELSVTARQQHFFHQPDDYEKVIMIGILFRH